MSITISTPTYGDRFPIKDQAWSSTLRFLKDHFEKYASIGSPRVLAPDVFLDHIQEVYPYQICYALPKHGFYTEAVVHKGMLDRIDLELLQNIRNHLVPVFANEVFVVYASSRPGLDQIPQGRNITDFLDRFEELKSSFRSALTTTTSLKICSLITTYNRPEFLKRSLPQVVKLGAPTLVVDDGSTAENREASRLLCKQLGAEFLSIPSNRGLANALNSGLNYWLADPEMEWIAYFQDDVDVHQKAFEIFRKVADRERVPLLTGRMDGQHPVYGESIVNGIRVEFMRTSPGISLFASRQYWNGVLPIPTPYVGAPKLRTDQLQQGADEDLWITGWSPNSVAKRGGYVVCIPGLVRTFSTSAEESTWGNEVGYEDPPLATYY